jgi:HK97 gp10 family phage protein
MASEMNVFGIDKLITELKNYSEKVNTALNNSVKEAATNVETRAKMDCPAPMGTLRASIQKRPIQDNEEYGWEVYTLLEYAPYVEFGTGTRVSIPTGYEEYAEQFWSHNEEWVGMNAQPYLIPNFEMEKMALIENIKKIIGNV